MLHQSKPPRAMVRKFVAAPWGRSQTRRSSPSAINRTAAASTLLLSLSRTALVVLPIAFSVGLAGCDGSGGARSKTAKSNASTKDGIIVGRRTQDIRSAPAEIQKGATVASTRINATDPITLSGNAYSSIIGRTSILLIDQAMNLYHASNDRYPKDYDEFMAEIIQANNIALPVLPPRQKYGYDEKEHKLVILEYPEGAEDTTTPATP